MHAVEYGVHYYVADDLPSRPASTLTRLGSRSILAMRVHEFRKARGLAQAALGALCVLDQYMPLKS
jgi:hypothetical protein